MSFVELMVPLLMAALVALFLALEGRRMRAGGPADALTFAGATLLLLFVFAPAHIFWFGDDAVRQKHVFDTYGQGSFGTFLYVIASYAAFALGFVGGRGRAAPAVDCAPRTLDGLPLRQVMGLVMGLTVCGLGALLFHTALVDGPANALRLAPLVRSGEFPLESRWLFVRQFCAFIATACMLQWAVVFLSIGRHGKAPGMAWVLLLVTTSAFVFFALSTYGRREFIFPFIILCGLTWWTAPRKAFFMAMLLGLLGIWAFCYLRLIPHYLWEAPVPSGAIGDFLQEFRNQHEEFMTSALSETGRGARLRITYLSLVRALNDSYMHLVAAQHCRLWQFGFFADIVEIPLQFVPSKLLGFERGRGMYEETSRFMLGHPLEPGLSGEEPLGLHGYLLVNLSYLGAVLGFALLGRAARGLDGLIHPLRRGRPIAWLLYAWVILAQFEFIRDGVLVLILKPRFSLWLTLAVLLWMASRSSANKMERMETP